jgi:Tfp pilus assembly protein PilV
MIELIFALVIMGITMLSAPLLISQATNSSLVAFQQESIAITASHANALLTYSWDEQNTQSQLNYINAILRVSGAADNELDSLTRVTPGARQFNPDVNATATALLGADVTTPNEADDDIDDFIDSSQTLTLASAAAGAIDAGDYIDQDVSLSTSVKYMDDITLYASATGVVVFNAPKADVNYTTNIKYISVSLISTSQSADLSNKQITLNAFMCNIGGARPDSSKGMKTGELQNAPAGLF